MLNFARESAVRDKNCRERQRAEYHKQIIKEMGDAALGDEEVGLE